MTTDQHNTQAARDQIEALARSHGTGGWQTLDDMVRFGLAVAAHFAQPFTPPTPDNAVVTSASGSTWEVDPKWAQALQAALDGKAATPSAEAASESDMAVYRSIADPYIAAQPAAPLFAASVAARKWQELQADGHRMTLIQFDGGKGGPGSIDPGGVVMWGAQPAAQQAEPVGEYLANVDEYGGVRWIGPRPPHGTKLYTSPPPHKAEGAEPQKGGV